MLCFVGTDDLSSPLCAPSPTGGSTHLPCRAGPMCPAVLLLSFRVCRGGRLCPPAHTGVGIRLSKKGSGLPRRFAPHNDSAALPRCRDVGTPSPTGGSTFSTVSEAGLCPAFAVLQERAAENAIHAGTPCMKRFSAVKNRGIKSAPIQTKSGICRNERRKTAAGGRMNGRGAERKMKFCAFRYCKNFTPAI